MPTLAQHASAEFVKVLYIGSSGSGKTGSLVSLMPDYELRILDLDNGLDALINHAKATCPERLGTVQYNSYQDDYQASPMGPVIAGRTPKAFVGALKALDKWPDDGSDPAEWGKDKVLVVDSLTALGKAAFEWAKGLNPTSKDPRQWYSAAQEAIDTFLDMVCGELFHVNVIVVSHIDFREDPTTKVTRGYASSIGKALGPKLPRHFNTLVMAESSVMGKTVKRQIHTVPTSLIDLKNPAPMRMSATYPLETGMAEIFKNLKEEK